MTLWVWQFMVLSLCSLTLLTVLKLGRPRVILGSLLFTVVPYFNVVLDFPPNWLSKTTLFRAASLRSSPASGGWEPVVVSEDVFYFRTFSWCGQQRYCAVPGCQQTPQKERLELPSQELLVGGTWECVTGFECVAQVTPLSPLHLQLMYVQTCWGA